MTLDLLPLLPAAGGRSARCAPGRRFVAIDLLQVDGEAALPLGDAEALALLLAGTFDLATEQNHWGGRGARTAPAAGRPLALFLPPRAQFTARGRGEILVLSAVQPAAAPATGRAALSQSPLLPLAGSGKAFDPHSGEWRRSEEFPTSAELLPPRRIERTTACGIAVERVCPPQYKAATLSVDELLLTAGQRFDVAALPGRPPADELLLFVRGRARVQAGGAVRDVDGDTVLLHRHPAGAPTLALEAIGGEVFAVLAHAGK